MKTTSVAGRNHIHWAVLGLFALGFSVGTVQAQEVDRVDQALNSGWSSETSDELPPIHCQGRIGGVRCTGKYCDNISVLCRDYSGETGDSNWDDFFSEEGTNLAIPDYQIPAGGLRGPFNGDICPESSVVTGFSCMGGYCDNISLECTDMPHVRLTSCRWTTKSYSEENGAVVFPDDELLAGVACFGKACDNMKYYLCEYE